MEKLKILFITQDLKNYIGQVSYDFQIALSKIVDLTVWHEPGDIREIIAAQADTPDFILLYNFTPLCCPAITGLSSINIPVGLKAEDPHYEVEKHKEFIVKNNIRYVFPAYYNEFCRRMPEIRDRFFWLPHCVNIEIYKDYGFEKSIDYLLMGSTDSYYYPLRAKISKTMSREKGFVFHSHPGYKNYISDEPGVYVKENYAKEINRSKIFLTDGSIFDYAVQKYFEVPACRTLLMAKDFNELRGLGFIPGVNFVDIDEYNFMEKARYYLRHEKERLEIAEKGYNLIISSHTTDHRATQFVKYVKSII